MIKRPRGLVLQGYFRVEAFRPRVLGREPALQPRKPAATLPGMAPPAGLCGAGRAAIAQPKSPRMPGPPRPELLPAAMRGPSMGAVQSKAAPVAGEIRAARLLPGQVRLVGTGEALAPELRGPIEGFFQADLSTVRVHEGPAASAIGAAAFTLGEDIYFAPGLFAPRTRAGLELLGHELTHVVQQRQGRVQNPFSDGVAVVQDPALEAEADQGGRMLGAYMADSLRSGSVGGKSIARPSRPPILAAAGSLGPAAGFAGRTMALQLAQTADPMTRGRVGVGRVETTPPSPGSATTQSTNPSIAPVGGTVQPSTSTGKLERRRWTTTNRLLDRATARKLAFQATAVIYHNGRRIKSFPFIDVRGVAPKHKYSHYYAQETDYDNEEYTIEKDETWTSKDGEMFLLELIVPYLDQYLSGLAASSETIDSDSGRLKSGSAPRTTPFGWGTPYPQLRDLDHNMHVIRVEFIGPKGTCINCQAALERYRLDLIHKYKQTKTGTTIIIKITTRYTELEGKKYVERFNKRYGSDRAREVTHFGRNQRRRAVRHWKLNIGDTPPSWLRDKQRQNIEKMRKRQSERRQQKFAEFRAKHSTKKR